MNPSNDCPAVDSTCASGDLCAPSVGNCPRTDTCAPSSDGDTCGPCCSTSAGSTTRSEAQEPNGQAPSTDDAIQIDEALLNQLDLMTAMGLYNKSDVWARFAPMALSDYKPFDVLLTDSNGEVIYRCDGFMAPKHFSAQAVQILASKYARKAGIEGEHFGVRDGAEVHARVIFERMARFWAQSLVQQGTLGSQDEETFRQACIGLLEHQVMAPNSPQWFNSGLYHQYGIKGHSEGLYYVDPATDQCQVTYTAYERPAPNACFINVVDDKLTGPKSITQMVVDEANVFRWGAGSGVNVSRIRGVGEPLSNGGVSSGLMSFLKISDRAAGAIKSGGTTRRAAKMVCLDIDHPDVQEFIDWKVEEEYKVAALMAGSAHVSEHLQQIAALAIELGAAHEQRKQAAQHRHGPCALDDQRVERARVALDTACARAQLHHVPVSIIDQAARCPERFVDVPAFDSYYEGEAYRTVSGQNSNNSVRVTNAFMKALAENGNHDLIRRTDGKVHKSVPARELWGQIAKAAWASADPGVQFHDIINEWHTCPNAGLIRASNPCVTGDTRVLCVADDGSLYEQRIDQMLQGPQRVWSDNQVCEVNAAFETGVKPVLRLSFEDGQSLTLTSDHMVTILPRDVDESTSHWSRIDVKAGELRVGDRVEKDWSGTATFGPNVGTSCWDQLVCIEALPEPQTVYDITVPQTSHFVANGYRVHNCSEYFFIDDTACNLLSVNLLKFWDGDREAPFDAEGFLATVRLCVMILEATVAGGSYPTPEVARKSYDYRTLGLGYTNLGALLMRAGIPYGEGDSLALTRAITGLLTSGAYAQSARMAAASGPFPGYEADAANVCRVLGNHAATIQNDLAYTLRRDDAEPLCRPRAYVGLTIEPSRVRTRTSWINELLLEALQEARVAEELCRRHGVRNAQVSVLAPTGTISFVMDADTTGIEPEFALVKRKYLAGGGVMTIVNQSVEAGLARLGWTAEQIREAVRALQEGQALRQAPSILRCAVAQPGIPALTWAAHLAILAAAQPMVSGGISKTVNVDADATPEEIAGVYQMAYLLMVKAMAVYRTGSKLSAPLAALHGKSEAVLNPNDPRYAPNATRHKLDRGTGSFTSDKIEIDGFSVYLHAGCYPGGQLAELFITAADEGSSLSGLLRTVGVLVSLMLQHAIPLDVVVKALEGGSFLPAGFVRGIAEVRTASSVTDAIAQYLRVRFLQGPVDQRQSNDNLGLSQAARTYHRNTAKARRNHIGSNPVMGVGYGALCGVRSTADDQACTTNDVGEARKKLWRFDASRKAFRAPWDSPTGVRSAVLAPFTFAGQPLKMAAGGLATAAGGFALAAGAAAGALGSSAMTSGEDGVVTEAEPGAHGVAAGGDAPKSGRAARVTGDLCRRCGNLTLVRTGPCKACSHCGESTGCG